MNELFDLSTILWHMLNAAILFTALYFLLYKPVRKFLKKREDSVNETIDSANSKLEEANALMEKSRGEVVNAQRQAAEAVSLSAQQAQKRAEEIIASANRSAEEIVQRANREAEQIRQNAREAMMDESARLSVLIASKLLEREVSQADHQKLIDEFLKKVGSAHV